MFNQTLSFLSSFYFILKPAGAGLSNWKRQAAAGRTLSESFSSPACFCACDAPLGYPPWVLASRGAALEHLVLLVVLFGL